MRGRGRAFRACAIVLVAAFSVLRAPADEPSSAARIAADVAALSGADAAARAAAVESLLTVGAPAVPALVAVVQDSASPARRDAATMLGLIGGDAASALAPLTALLTDVKAKAQAEAATAIGRIAVGAAKPVDPKGAPPNPVDRAMQAGADWLVRHQNEDGSWSCLGFGLRCAKKDECSGAGETRYDPGITGLAILALLGAGDSPVKGPHAANVAAGLRNLAARQDADGCFGPRLAQHFQYNHAIATIAVGEAYRRTRAVSLRGMLERAIRFIEASRNPDLAWRYNVPHDGDNDTSLTVWMARALDVASSAGIEVDHAAMNGALKWVDNVTDEKTGRTGYQQKGGPPARTSETMNSFPAQYSESMTAAAMSVRLSVGRTRESDPYLAMGETLLAARVPVWDVARGTTDLYYWVHGAEALHWLGGAAWDAWRKALVGALVPSQRPATDGCSRGSWDPHDPWCQEGGRIWMTTAAMLCLEHAAADPARRPALPQTVRPCTWALEKLLKAQDPVVRAAARRALDAIRGAYK